MGETVKEPCPHCQEPASLAAQVCPHCRRSLLFDVGLAASVTDPRARYQVARAVAVPGGAALPLGAVQQTLAGPAPLLARAATWELR